MVLVPVSVGGRERRDGVRLWKSVWSNAAHRAFAEENLGGLYRRHVLHRRHGTDFIWRRIFITLLFTYAAAAGSG